MAVCASHRSPGVVRRREGGMPEPRQIETPPTGLAPQPQELGLCTQSPVPWTDAGECSRLAALTCSPSALRHGTDANCWKWLRPNWLSTSGPFRNRSREPPHLASLTGRRHPGASPSYASYASYARRAGPGRWAHLAVDSIFRGGLVRVGDGSEVREDPGPYPGTGQSRPSCEG